MLAIVGRALLSWIDPGMNSVPGKFLYKVTEPILGPVRSVIPGMGMFDFSPIIVILGLQVLKKFIDQAL